MTEGVQMDNNSLFGWCVLNELTELVQTQACSCSVCNCFDIRWNNLWWFWKRHSQLDCYLVLFSSIAQFHATFRSLPTQVAESGNSVNMTTHQRNKLVERRQTQLSMRSRSSTNMTALSLLSTLVIGGHYPNQKTISVVSSISAPRKNSILHLSTCRKWVPRGHWHSDNWTPHSSISFTNPLSNQRAFQWLIGIRCKIAPNR
jgi:hypothetical protein